MKLLFVRPNQVGIRSVPIGMTSLQASVKNANHEVKIFDTTFLSENVEKVGKRREALGFFKPTDIRKFVKIKKANVEQKLITTYRNFQPDIVAFSLMSNDFVFTKQLASTIRKINSNTPIILGGIHPTVDPEGTIKLDCVDMLCIGEGEEALVELLDKMEKGKDITRIENIWVKIKNKVFRNDVRPFLDMNTLLPPDCTSFSQMHLYRPFWGKVYRIIDVEISRGCFYSCNECVNGYLQRLYKHKCSYHREKKIEKTITDLKTIKERYKPEMFKFIDEVLFPWSIEKLREFGKLYKQEVGLPFIGFGRVEYLLSERVKLLKEIGCVSLSIGIESGNEELRKRILNRHMTNRRIIEAFQVANKHRLRTTAFNLIALPEEGRKEIFDTIRINRLANPGLVAISFVYPFCGTALRDYCLEKEYIKGDEPTVDYNKDTIIKNTKIRREEQIGLHKTFVLYVLAPKWLYPVIRFCEFDNPVANRVFSMLIRYFRNMKFRKNDLRFNTTPDTRELSALEHPPVEEF